jgi:TRAP-type uncharacterized transport system substrate-binding protein
MASAGAAALAAQPTQTVKKPVAVRQAAAPSGARATEKQHVRRLVPHVHRVRSDDRKRDVAAEVPVSETAVALLADGIGSTDLAIAQQLSAVLGDGDRFRILPIVGASGGRNIRDLRLLKGVDLAITESSALARLNASGEIGALDDKIVYVTKLFNEELHVLVRANSGLGAIGQLAGHTVNLGEAGGGAQLLARDVFGRLGIAVRELNVSDGEAVERLKSGDIDAVVLIGGKPVPVLANLSPDLRVLPVPFAKPLRDDFLPAILSSDDYPGLIEPGHDVETIAVGTVLIANNWPKDSENYRKIEKFVDVFFSELTRLQAPRRHPKWREVNLAATLPGWKRFGAAEDWLARHREPVETEREKFDRFVSARGMSSSPGQREKLFQEFQDWSDARPRR